MSSRRRVPLVTRDRACAGGLYLPARPAPRARAPARRAPAHHQVPPPPLAISISASYHHHPGNLPPPPRQLTNTMLTHHHHPANSLPSPPCSKPPNHLPAGIISHHPTPSYHLKHCHHLLTITLTLTTTLAIHYLISTLPCTTNLLLTTTHHYPSSHHQTHPTSYQHYPVCICLLKVFIHIIKEYYTKSHLKFSFPLRALLLLVQTVLPVFY